jgi:hypothetical protein
VLTLCRLSRCIGSVRRETHRSVPNNGAEPEHKFAAN